MTARYETRLNLFGPLPVDGIPGSGLKGIRDGQLVGRFAVRMRVDAPDANEATEVMHAEAWRTFRPNRAPQRAGPVHTLEDRAAVASGPRAWAAQRTTAELLGGDYGRTGSRDALEAWVSGARTGVAARMAGRPGSEDFKRRGGYLRVLDGPPPVQLGRITFWREAWNSGLASEHAAIAATAAIASRVLPSMDPAIVPLALLDGIQDALTDSLLVAGAGSIGTCNRPNGGAADFVLLSALKASLDALERIRDLVVAAARAKPRRAREFRAEARTAARDVVRVLEVAWGWGRGRLVATPITRENLPVDNLLMALRTIASLAFAPLEEMRRHALAAAPMAKCAIAMLRTLRETPERRASPRISVTDYADGEAVRGE